MPAEIIIFKPGLPGITAAVNVKPAPVFENIIDGLKP
jgi:hypothetical protein